MTTTTTNKNTAVTTTTTTSNEKTEKDFETFAIPMDPAHYELVRSAAKQLNVPMAKFGRALVLAEAARVMCVDVPVVTEGKRGPKGGSKHPLAQKHSLTTAEFNRRLAFHVQAHAQSGSKKKFDMDKVDFSVNPFAKPAVTEPAVTEGQPVVEAGAGLEVEAT